MPFIGPKPADTVLDTTLIGDGTVTKAKLATDAKTNISDDGTEGTKVAVGTSAQRGSTTGQFRFNSTTGLAEYYTGNEFKTIDIAPLITSINVSNITQAQIDAGFDVVITGSNFSSGATVKFIGNDGTEYTSPTVTVNSGTQITARVTSNIDASKEPFDVQVTSAGGLSSSKDNLFNINASPTWSTASGNLGTISDYADATHFTLSATDPEGATVSYTESTSNLTGAGLALSSAGAITGNPNDVSSNTTVSFAVNASDGTNTVNRAFNIIVTPALDGSTSAKAALSAKAIRDLGITTDGAYYLKNANGDTYQAYCEMGVQGGGWELIWNTAGSGTVNDDPRSDFAGYTNKNFWTNQTYTVGTHATPYNTVMYKSSGYQYRNDFTKIMIVAHNAGGACTTDFGATSSAFGDVGGIWTLNSTYANKSWYQLMNDYGNATTIATFTTLMGALTNSTQTSGTIVNTTRNGTNRGSSGGDARTIGLPLFDNQLDLVTNVYMKGTSGTNGSANFDSNGGVYDLNERTPTSNGAATAGSASNRTPDFAMSGSTLFNLARLTGKYSQRSLDVRNLSNNGSHNAHQTHGGIATHHRQGDYVMHSHAHFSMGYHDGEFSMGTSESQNFDGGNSEFYQSGAVSSPYVGRSRVDFAIFVKKD